MNKRAKTIPLIIEPHPEDYNGYPFLTIVRYDNIDYICIVDNADDRSIDAFVVDLCEAESVDENEVIETAISWYMENKDRYRISVEFSKRELISKMGKIYKSFNIDYVTRIIGPLPKYNLREIVSIRRRKKRTVSINEMTYQKISVI